MRDKSIKKEWEKFILKYKKYFISDNEKWLNTLNDLNLFIDKNKRLPIESKNNIIDRCIWDDTNDIPSDDDESLSSRRSSHTKEVLYYSLYKPSLKLTQPIPNYHMDRKIISNTINLLSRNNIITCFSKLQLYEKYMAKLIKKRYHIKNIKKYGEYEFWSLVSLKLKVQDICYDTCDVIRILRIIRRRKYLITIEDFDHILNYISLLYRM
jgi:hypothetical protein